MSDSIRSNVSQFLQSLGITFSALPVGETGREDGWKCDQWFVTIKRTGSKAPDMTIPYYTGLGHRKAPPPPSGAPYRPGTIAHEAWRKLAKPQAPHAADVLHSLILDSSAADQSFNDWCADFGYDSDSVKALTTYQACCVIGENMRKLFSREELSTLRDMLQDY